MGTVADKLNYLLETKNRIKQALIDKGVEVPENTTFRGYADLIGGAVGKKITEVSISPDVDSYTLKFEDGSSLSGWAEFDEYGFPTNVTDDAGNRVVFALTNPVFAVDSEGNQVTIIMEGE